MNTATSDSSPAYMKQDIFALSVGVVMVSWPSTMSADEGADVLEWLKIVERKIRRSFAAEASAPNEKENV